MESQLRRVFNLDESDTVLGAHLEVAEYYVASSESWDDHHGSAYIVGRSNVLSEMGGDFSGAVAGRLAKAFGQSYPRLLIECNWSTSLFNAGDGPAAHIAQAVLACILDGSYVVGAKPVVVIAKDEERSCPPYGDVAFKWPAVDPIAAEERRQAVAKEQFSVNCSVLGVSETEALEGMRELAHAFVHGCKRSKVSI